MYTDDMMILCLRYIVNEQEALETLMDAWLSFFGKIDSFVWRGEGSTKAWLKKIVTNQCLMRLRKKRLPVITPDYMPEHVQSNEDDIIGHLAAKEILELLRQLPDMHRTVFNLCIFEEMPHHEVAALLEMTESTSRSYLFRAREILKKQLLNTRI